MGKGKAAGFHSWPTALLFVEPCTSQVAHEGRGATDRGEYREAAGAIESESRAA